MYHRDYLLELSSQFPFFPYLLISHVLFSLVRIIWLVHEVYCFIFMNTLFLFCCESHHVRSISIPFYFVISVLSILSLYQNPVMLTKFNKLTWLNIFACLWTFPPGRRFVDFELFFVIVITIIVLLCFNNLEHPFNWILVLFCSTDSISRID